MYRLGVKDYENMKEYMYILIGIIFLYVSCWHEDEWKQDVIFIDIHSPLLARILDLSGKRRTFAVAGIVMKLYAHVSLIFVALFIFIHEVVLDTKPDMLLINAAWTFGAYGIIFMAYGIETVLKSKKKKGRVKKIADIIFEIILFGSSLAFLIGAILLLIL